MNAHIDSRAIHLLTLYSFNVDNAFLPVNLDYLANLLAFVVSWHNLYLIILSGGHGLKVVLLSQLFRKTGRHNLPVNVGRYPEMPFLVLGPVRNYEGIELHAACWHFSDGCKREE